MVSDSPTNKEVILLKGNIKTALAIQNVLKKKPEETKVVPFIQIEDVVEGKKYAYLEISKNSIKRTYLFDPLSFKHFKQKKQCDSLWHGCEEPSLLMITEYANSLS